MYNQSEATCKIGEKSDVFHIAANKPLPFIKTLSHHNVDGRHLWIGVEHGVLVVLNEREDRLFRDLNNGMTVSSLLNWFHKNNPNPSALNSLWVQISELLTLLAKAGFVEGIRGYNDVKGSRPQKFARFHLTRRCQLECIHCYASSGPKIPQDNELNTKEWINIIENVAGHGGESVLFTGGEPLLRTDCPELIRRAKQLGLKTSLFTNGLLLKKNLPQLKEFTDFIQVSLGSPEEKSNDIIRGKGTYRKILESVELVLKAGIPIRLNLTVMQENWSAIKEEFLDFAGRYKHTPLTFGIGYGVCNYGRGTLLKNDLDEDMVRQTIDAILEQVNVNEAMRITRKTNTCGYCEQLVVAPDGAVHPCHLLDGAMGKITDRSFPEWYELLRKTASDYGVDRLEVCKDCDLRYLCGGYCRVLNEQLTGSKFISPCNPEEVRRKYSNLVKSYRAPNGHETNIRHTMNDHRPSTASSPATRSFASNMNIKITNQHVIKNI